MANPRITSSKSRAGKEKGYFQTAVDEVTRPENRSVLIAVSMFAAGVAFFHSGLSEILVAPS